MNCNDFERIALALARNQLIDAATREHGLTHSKMCVRCANRLAEERALIASVSAVVAAIAKQKAPDPVEAALLTAFREQVKGAASPAIVQMPIKTSHSRLWKLASAAAGILILISVIAIFWLPLSSREQKHEAQTVSPAPFVPPAGPRTSSPAPLGPATNSDQAMANPVTTRSRSQVPRRASDESEDEVVTEFFALVDQEQLDSLDSLQMVRVELPSSALSTVGLPIDVESANEPVKADVVLGQDGLARAIRFVR